MDESGDNVLLSRHQSRWEPQWFERACELVRTGLTATEIAAQMSRETGMKFTRCGVIGKLARKGITLPPKNSDGSARKLKPRPRQRRQASVLPATVPEVPPAPKPSPPPPQPVSFADAQPHHCRWIVRDPVPTIDELLFCGAPRLHRSVSYCEEHYRRSRQAKGGTND